jgi:RNA polymerase sigma-70 factor (ECF subfamily)
MEYLAALNRKEARAWECFYRDYYASLCAYVCRFVKDHDRAEDIVQETLINVWRSDRAFYRERDLAAYLYKSVYTNSMQYLRTRDLHDTLLRRLQQETVMEGEEELFALTVREELVRQLRVAIRELPGQRRKILELSLEGLPGNEIAERLGITIHTVKTQKNKAFTYLRQRLGAIYPLLALYLPLKML